LFPDFRDFGSTFRLTCPQRLNGFLLGICNLTAETRNLLSERHLSLLDGNDFFVGHLDLTVQIGANTAQIICCGATGNRTDNEKKNGQTLAQNSFLHDGFTFIKK